MSKFEFIPVTVAFEADLQKIIKYHPPSKIYKQYAKKSGYNTSVDLIMKAKKVNNKFEIIKEHHYSDRISELMPTGQNSSEETYHENNLLALVKNIIEIEWGYYLSYNYSNGKAKNKGASIYYEPSRILTALLQLYKMKCDDTYKTLEATFGTASVKISQTGKKLKLPIKPIGIALLTDEEKLMQIDLLIVILKNRLLSPEYEFLPFSRRKVKKWGVIEIEEAIKKMHQPFEDEDALSVFRHSVVQKVLEYLKGEINWETKAHMNKAQSQIIYLLLSIFGLLDDNEKRRDETAKSNYIQSILTNSRVSTFFKFT